MAQQITTVRNPPPRMLTVTETLHSLNHWKTTFRTYYRRDSYYKVFLLPNAEWDPRATNYGQSDDLRGDEVVRTAMDKGEDLKDFLNTLAGYLPFPYLTEKIVEGSKNLQEVWDVIYDHYGISVTSESLLDYVSIQINAGETYRQFFDRLLSHARLHLPKANVTIDGIATGPSGEKMTVALMNFVAMDWLNKINPHLIGIIRTEYSKELRDNTQLVELVPRLATNINSMLSRHDIVGGSGKPGPLDNETIDKVNRIKFEKNNFKNKKTFKQQKRKPFCPECHFLARKLNLDVNHQHTPADCPRLRAAINLLLAGEEDLICESEEESDYQGNIADNNSFYELFNEKQISPEDPEQNVNSASTAVQLNNGNDFTEINYTALYQKVLNLQQKANCIRKEYSPQLRTSIGSHIADSTIDEGSELNCICSSIAAKCHIKYDPIKIEAVAAGSNVMKLLGVVPYDIEFNVYESKTPVKIVLKKAVIVKNLGPNILIGEPGKMDNNIITLPKQKLIQLKNIYGKNVQLPYRSHNGTPKQHYQPS